MPRCAPSRPDPFCCCLLPCPAQPTEAASLCRDPWRWIRTGAGAQRTGTGVSTHHQQTGREKRSEGLQRHPCLLVWGMGQRLLGWGPEVRVQPALGGSPWQNHFCPAGAACLAGSPGPAGHGASAWCLRRAGSGSQWWLSSPCSPGAREREDAPAAALGGASS